MNDSICALLIVIIIPAFTVMSLIELILIFVG